MDMNRQYTSHVCGGTNTQKIFFALCVDELLIEYDTKEDANHLLNILGESYKISTDYEAALYCGMT